MEKLEIKTRKGSRNPKYIQNVDTSTVFLTNGDDYITTKVGHNVEIQVYEDGQVVFIGNKTEFFEKLKK